MSVYYRDYIWKDGLPYGVDPVPESAQISYKVLSDPYHRQVFIEKYVDGRFSSLIYDSRLLNFRKLNPQNQTAWERTIVSETEERIVAHIRNEDDQLIVIETMDYVDGLCRLCRLESPQGIFLSEHRMHYKCLGDAYDGVAMFDSNDHQVLLKKYTFDEESRQFTDLLTESWESAIK